MSEHKHTIKCSVGLLKDSGKALLDINSTNHEQHHYSTNTRPACGWTGSLYLNALTSKEFFS
jgi:hypothetical protein